MTLVCLLELETVSFFLNCHLFLSFDLGEFFRLKIMIEKITLLANWNRLLYTNRFWRGILCVWACAAVEFDGLVTVFTYFLLFSFGSFFFLSAKMFESNFFCTLILLIFMILFFF